MGKIIQRLLAISKLELANDDLIPVQDVSEPKTKAITISELKKAMVDAMYPVNATVVLYDGQDPNTLYPGTTWVNSDTWVDRQLIATKVLHWSTGDTGASTTKQKKLGVYSYMMLDDMLMSPSNNVTETAQSIIPSGYHVEYKLMAEVSTNHTVAVAVFLNNIVSNYAGTYSGDTFRRTVATNFFKRSDIVLETTVGYSQTGINFGWVADQNANLVRVYLPTLSAYLVRDTPNKRWKRTA